jgi:hypothetical protein
MPSLDESECPPQTASQPRSSPARSSHAMPFHAFVTPSQLPKSRHPGTALSPPTKTVQTRARDFGMIERNEIPRQIDAPLASFPGVQRLLA